MFKRKIQSIHPMKLRPANPPGHSIFLACFLSVLGVLLQMGIGSPVHAMEIETPPPVSGRAVTPGGILPADVLARATLVLAELEQIRFEMGKPDKKWSTLVVQNAAPREVYFQALTLFQKTNRLSFEQTGRMHLEHTPLSTGDILPFDVWTLVNKSLKRVLLTKKNWALQKK